MLAQASSAQPTLVERLRRAWLSLRGRDLSGSDLPQTSFEGYLTDPQGDYYRRRWAEPLERRSLCEELATLYADHPLTEAALLRYSRGAATGLAVTVERSSPQSLLAERIVERTLRNTQIARYLPAIAYTLAGFGDAFVQIVVDQSGELVDAVEMPAADMVRNTDARDQFISGEPAFIQRSESGAVLAEFSEGQIIHARNRHRRGDRYGRPELFASRGAIRDSLAALRSILPRRLANQPFRHFDVRGPNGQGVTWPVFEQLKRSLSRVFHLERGGKLSPFDDLFTTNTQVSVLGGDAQAESLGDIELLLDLSIAPLGIPRQLLGFGTNINRDVLDEQRAELYANQRQFQQELERQIVRPLLDTALALAGISPDAVRYSCHWADSYTESHTERRLDRALRAAEQGLISPEEFRAIASDYFGLQSPATPANSLTRRLTNFRA